MSDKIIQVRYFWTTTSKMAFKPKSNWRNALINVDKFLSILSCKGEPENPWIPSEDYFRLSCMTIENDEQKLIETLIIDRESANRVVDLFAIESPF